jgi:outer membrane protein TolC
MNAKKKFLLGNFIIFIIPAFFSIPSYGLSEDTSKDQFSQELKFKVKQDSIPQNPESGTLKLTSLIEEALSENPGIKAAYQDYEARLQKIPQARSLADPMLKYTYFAENIETRVGPQENILSLSQSFPFYKKRSLKADVASREAEAALEVYEAKKRIVIARIKKLFYELFYYYKAIDIAEEEKALLRRLSKIASVKYSTGEGSQQNILQIQVEITKLNERLLTLEQQKQTIESHINSLLNRPQHRALARPENVNESHFPYDLETLNEMAQKNRQEIKAAEAMIRKNESSLRLFKKEYYPDFTFGFQYVDVGRRFGFIDDNGKDSWSVSMMVNLPIWKKRLNAGVQESLARIESSAFTKNEIENQTLFEVKDTYLKLKTAEDILNLYDTTLIPQAEQSFKSAESGYQTGRSDFFNLLDSERVLLSAHLAYYRALTDHEQSIADLERYVGADLTTEY